MSTIKVDTYLTRGGASEIAIDKLKGVSSAGSMSVVGEGGSTTTNLQQGLAKHWVKFAPDAVADDSLNNSSITDTDTGRFTVTRTNNMGNTNYCHLVHAIVASYYTQYLANSFAKATGSYREEQDSFDGSSTTTNRDHTHCNLGILGDLA